MFGLGHFPGMFRNSLFTKSFRAALVTFKVVVLLSLKDPHVCRSLNFPWKRAIYTYIYIHYTLELFMLVILQQPRNPGGLIRNDVPDPYPSPGAA